MKIYLAGSVPKGDKEAIDYVDWRKEYIEIISKYVDDVELFDPNIFYALEGDSKGVTGADCSNIQESDLVIVNAKEKIGAGTAMEFVIAKYFSKPVITILPKNTHHRRSNLEFEGRIVEDWIHPFIDTFSDVVIEDIELVKIALEEVKNEKIKSITVIDESIEYAKKTLNEKQS
ncbi:MAG TPA: hypothetical protein PLD54_04790 [Candidatus Levybacteria bacterium]|nr:hypothetical protein [Candidatus Levybacteria bacterium]